MFDILKALLFRTTWLLTPAPIDIGPQWTEIPLAGPVEALNEGAGLRIDVTQMLTLKIASSPASWNARVERADGNGYDDRAMVDTDPNGALRRFHYLGELFPEGCITARLTQPGHDDVLIHSHGAELGAAKSYILVSLAPLPADPTFSRLAVRADCPVKAAYVSWRNAGAL